MSAHDALAGLGVTVLMFAAAGLVLGAGYFVSLRRVVELVVARRAGWLYVPLGLARMGAAALFFAFAARWGASALLAAFAGFLAARQLAVWPARRIA